MSKQNGFWFQMSCEVAKRTDLESGPKLLYGVLADYARLNGNDAAWPGVRCLATELGTARTNVTRWVTALESAGLIRVTVGTGRATNQYTLMVLPETHSPKSSTKRKRSVPPTDHKPFVVSHGSGPPTGHKGTVVSHLDAVVSRPRTEPRTRKERVVVRSSPDAAQPVPGTLTTATPCELLEEENTEMTEDQATDNERALEQVGIHLNERTRSIARRDGMTPGYILRRSREGKDTAALITALEQDPPLKMARDGPGPKPPRETPMINGPSTADALERSPERVAERERQRVADRAAFEAWWDGLTTGQQRDFAAAALQMIPYKPAREGVDETADPMKQAFWRCQVHSIYQQQAVG